MWRVRLVVIGYDWLRWSSNQKDRDGPVFNSSLFLPFILLSCLYPHGGDQAWRQRSVLSYTLRLLFVEKAGGAHTMVKVMLNVPFRNNSSIWTDIAPEQNKATCRASWNEKCCLRKISKLCARSDASLTTSERWTTFCLRNTTFTGTKLTHKSCILVRPQYYNSLFYLNLFWFINNNGCRKMWPFCSCFAVHVLCLVH